MTRVEYAVNDRSFVLTQLGGAANSTLSYEGGVQQTATGNYVFVTVEDASIDTVVDAANNLVVGLCVHSLLGSRTVPLGRVRADGGRKRDPLPVLALGTCVFILLQFAAFPNVVTGDGTVINLFLRLLGYCFGYTVPYVTFQIAPMKIDRPSPTA